MEWPHGPLREQRLHDVAMGVEQRRQVEQHSRSLNLLRLANVQPPRSQAWGRLVIRAERVAPALSRPSLPLTASPAELTSDGSCTQASTRTRFGLQETTRAASTHAARGIEGMTSFLPHPPETVLFENLHNLCWSAWWQLWHDGELVGESHFKSA
jgi:hypothetical protein